MIDIAAVRRRRVTWLAGVRIIRAVFPPIDLFEDIADPADWPLLLAGEQKTNPRLMDGIGDVQRVPPARRVSGSGGGYLMAPFTHASPDRPSRFSDGRYGVLYVAQTFETALMETLYHHARFMAATAEAPGWTSQFREIVMAVDAELDDVTALGSVLAPDSYVASQDLGAALRAQGSDGVVYPSVRHAGGACVGLFFPDLAAGPRQGRHLDYHWDGARVDLYRVAGGGPVYRVGA